MGTSSYPGMAQSFSMTHGTNMTTVAGMRQDAMGKLSYQASCMFYYTLIHNH